MSSSTEIVIALEHRTWDALMSSGSTLIPFLSSDCSMLFPGGMTLHAASSPSLRESLADGGFKPWDNFSLTEVRAVEINAEAVAVMYQAKAIRDGTEYKALISSVWKREAGEWKMVLHQQTPM